MASASNYLKVYKDWLKANRMLSGDSSIPIEVLLTGLSFSDVLSKFERQLVDAEKTGDEKLLKLFTEVMPAKGEQGFKQVVEILTEKKCTELTIDLIGVRNKQFAATANSSTTSKSSYAVSYLQIYKTWLKNDQDLNGDSTIPVEVVLDKLMFLLTNEEYQMVDKQETNGKKLKKLFVDILPSKDKQGFDQLVKILCNINCDGLANELLKCIPY